MIRLAADHDGRDGDHLVDPRVEPGCLAIQDQDLVRRPRLEQESVGVVCQRRAIEQIAQPAPHSERPEIVTAANELAELANHPKGITQNVPLHGGDPIQAQHGLGLHGPFVQRNELGSEPKLHEDVQGTGQLPSERRLQDACPDEGLDPGSRWRLEDALVDRERCARHARSETFQPS